MFQFNRALYVCARGTSCIFRSKLAPLKITQFRLACIELENGNKSLKINQIP